MSKKLIIMLLGKSSSSAEQTKMKTAEEKINFKITTAQIKCYSETQTMPTLQYLADELCEDNDMEYVHLKQEEQAGLEKITVGETDSILTKLKEYPYEFEIDKDLKLASINGTKVATTTPKNMDITKNGEYDVTDYTSVNVSVPSGTNPQNCSINISNDGVLSVSGVQNLKSFILIRDGKYLDVSKASTYDLPVTGDTPKEIRIIAVDDDANIYNSNSITYEKNTTYLYNSGTTYQSLVHKNRTSYGGCTSDFGNEFITINGYSNGGGGGLRTEQKIDLTNYNQIKLTGEVTDTAYSDSHGLLLAVSNSENWGKSWSPDNYEKMAESTTLNTLTIDVSNLSGEHYIYFGVNQCTAKVYSLSLE